MRDRPGRRGAKSFRKRLLGEGGGTEGGTEREGGREGRGKVGRGRLSGVKASNQRDREGEKSGREKVEEE